MSACAAYIGRGGATVRARRRRARHLQERGIPHRVAVVACLGVAVALAIVLMKIVPGVPGSFTRAEWIAFAAWSAFGLVFWLARRR